jgi:hypothetical protein
VICNFELGLTKESPPFPIVLSKWDSVSGEFIHRDVDHPIQGNIRIEYWTDRP